ncbi:glycosyltransferase family 2 protein [Ottowia thiooxydans]|uniref:glycosyltransferase family 2 protein n=1 Tax=Ottowia thiooxydans TaxID=219182 RepID=UPI00041D99A9|nr:galactosyltransferase-related protein [Ottowia thiooxydans]
MSANIILTYRGDPSGVRHANLLTVLAFLAETPEWPVLIVEQDGLPSLGGPLPHPNCAVLFAYNAGSFNKAWGLNIGVRRSNAPVIVFTDADLLIPDMLPRSVEHCLRNTQMVKPYRQVLDLSPETTAHLRAGDQTALQRMPGTASTRQMQGETAPLCGGAFAIRRDAFLKLGGWDERFVGWGGEDDAFSYKVQRARLATLEFDDAIALHLHHPRSRDRETHAAQYASNLALLERYHRYDQPQLERLQEVQSQIMGRSEKYRPQSAS